MRSCVNIQQQACHSVNLLKCLRIEVLSEAARLSQLRQTAMAGEGNCREGYSGKSGKRRAPVCMDKRAKNLKAFDFDVVPRQGVTDLARRQIQQARGFRLHPSALFHGPHQTLAFGHVRRLGACIGFSNIAA